MTADQVRTYLRASPFKPFTVRMLSGDTVDVRKPDCAGFTPDYRNFLVNRPYASGGHVAIPIAKVAEIDEAAQP